MKTFREVLMERDGMSKADADYEFRYALDHITELIQLGDFLELEDYLMDTYGLEPDYLDEFLF